MYEKPLYPTPEGYRRSGKNPNKFGEKCVRSNGNAEKKQMPAIDKYRNMLNLPVKNNSDMLKRGNTRHVVISEEAAKLIALSIKGLLNS